MKYALSFLFITFFAFYLQAVEARSIFSFRHSEALSTIAQFMYDATEDIPVSLRLSDKKIIIKNFSTCTPARAEDVIADVESSIKKVLRYYPDEELPVDQALVDLEDYLNHKDYRRCTFEKKTAESFVRTIYYTDLSDKIHLRLDNLRLSAE